MCVNCLTRWCANCTRPAEFSIVAAGHVVRACRQHVDELRESTARVAGVRPSITDFTPTTSGGTR